MRNVQSVDTLDWSTTLCSYALLMRDKLSFMSAPPASESYPGLALSCLLQAFTTLTFVCNFQEQVLSEYLTGHLEQCWLSLHVGKALMQWLPAFGSHRQQQCSGAVSSAEDWPTHVATFRFARAVTGAAEAHDQALSQVRSSTLKLARSSAWNYEDDIRLGRQSCASLPNTAIWPWWLSEWPASSCTAVLYNHMSETTNRGYDSTHPPVPVLFREFFEEFLTR